MNKAKRAFGFLTEFFFSFSTQIFCRLSHPNPLSIFLLQQLESGQKYKFILISVQYSSKMLAIPELRDLSK